MEVNHTAFQKRKEKEYTNFFRSLLLFLTHSIEELNKDESISVKKRDQLERNLVTSLSLIWNMYMIIFTKNTLPIKSHSVEIDEKYSRALLPLIQQLKKYIEKYPFINKTYKIKSVHMLEQILQFHVVGSNEEDLEKLSTPPPAPWLANLVYK